MEPIKTHSDEARALTFSPPTPILLAASVNHVTDSYQNQVPIRLGITTDGGNGAGRRSGIHRRTHLVAAVCRLDFVVEVSPALA